MKVMVTGGAGFIGSNFLEMLVPRHPEHTFVNVDKLTYAANLDNLRNVDCYDNYCLEMVDIADGAVMADLFERHNPDLVVHFAAESHVDRSIVGPGAFVRTNIEGTFQLLDACRRAWKNKPGLFHHVSTDEVYGALGATGSFTEETRYDPSSPYSASKAAADHIVRAYSKTYGMRVRITNCSNNYGPYQFPEKLIPMVITNALANKPIHIFGDGLGVRDWVYVQDHCKGIWDVIQRGKDGETYNIGGGTDVTNIDVVHKVLCLLSRYTDKSLVRLTDLIEFTSQRPGHDHRYAVDCTKIRESLGWVPEHTLQAGLENTVRWYVERNC